MSDWRSANPVRLSVANQLGGDIDGAWWPRVDRMTVELPGLVAALTPMLGEITSINEDDRKDPDSSTWACRQYVGTGKNVTCLPDYQSISHSTQVRWYDEDSHDDASPDVLYPSSKNQLDWRRKISNRVLMKGVNRELG